MTTPANEEPIAVPPTTPAPIKRTRGAPRPKVFNPRLRAEVCALLTIGFSRRRAALTIGCSPATLRNECRRDPEFAAAVQKAETQREAILLKRIHDATKVPVHWRAAAWLLERWNPERYVKRRPGTMTPEQVATVLAQFAEVVETGVRDAQDRQRVGTDLKLLTCALTQQAAGDSSS